MPIWTKQSVSSTTLRVLSTAYKNNSQHGANDIATACLLESSPRLMV